MKIEKTSLSNHLCFVLYFDNISLCLSHKKQLAATRRTGGVAYTAAPRGPDPKIEKTSLSKPLHEDRKN